MSVFIRILLCFITIALLTGCEQARLDEQVKELCAKDGGIKIYETVKLSPEKINQWGQPNFYKATLGENALGPEYMFKRETNYLREGSPSMSRTQYQVIRRLDGKLLGQTVIYSRRGGDLPSPMHDSYFTCPDSNEAGDVKLLISIFVRQ